MAVPDGLAVGGHPGALWPVYDLLQSLCPVAQGRGIGRLLEEISRAYDGDIVTIDSSCIRTHQHEATEKNGNSDDGCMGRSRGGLTTKIHAVIDAEGRPVVLDLSPGQAHDGKAAERMLDLLGSGDILLADRAYDGNIIRAFTTERGAWANIPARGNRQ